MVATSSAVPSLPQAVANVVPQSAEIRKAVVASHEPGRLTVRIASAVVPTEAAFLSSYTPVLGDTVAVAYQNGTWTVLGTYGGSIEANTEVPNHSFELSAPGTTPTGWQVVASVGSPTFTAFTWTRDDWIDGLQVGRLNTTGAGTVNCDIVSPPIPVETSQQWACAAYVCTDSDFAVTSTCTIRLMPTWRSDTSLGTPVRQDTSGFYSVTRGMPWKLLRAQGLAGLTAPAGASWLRLQLAVAWTAAAGDSLYIDRIIARRLT